MKIKLFAQEVELERQGDHEPAIWTGKVLCFDVKLTVQLADAFRKPQRAMLELRIQALAYNECWFKSVAPDAETATRFLEQDLRRYRTALEALTIPRVNPG